MKTNYPYIYHCHTSRCGHAQGSDEEYVLKAIENGYKVLCFTDHAPFPGVSQKGVRMDYSELDSYIEDITELKNKYKDQIEIHVGLEIEVSMDTNEYLAYLVNEKHLDFLIIGEHCFPIHGRLVYANDIKNEIGIEGLINLYKDSLINAMNTGLIKYLAHPDYINTFIDEVDDFAIDAVKEIVECAIKNDIPLELDCQGLRNGHEHNHKVHYPVQWFWEIVSQYKDAKVVVGIDAHDPKHIECYNDINECLDIAKKAGCKITKEIKIK